MSNPPCINEIVDDILDGIDDRDWFSHEGMARIRNHLHARAVAEGQEGIKLHFRAENLFTQALNAKPSFRERQEAWLARQEEARPMIEEASDPLRDALEAIAAGHNDPRSLAIEVLASLDQEGPSDMSPEVPSGTPSL